MERKIFWARQVKYRGHFHAACNAKDSSSIPGSRRSPRQGSGNPLQDSCLENSMDRGAWWATVHGVAKSWTQLSDFDFTSLRTYIWAPQIVLVVKSPVQETYHIQAFRLDPWVGKIPWRRAWPPTPVFLPGESHGQRSLEGYGSQGHKKSDKTEVI